MKNSALLLLLVFLGACAGAAHQRIVPGDAQLLGGENLWRSGQLAENKALKACYDGETSEYLEITRSRHAKNRQELPHWMEIASCYLWRDQPRLARFYLDLAGSLAKTNYEKAWHANNLAVFYLRSGKLSRAKELWQLSHELAPQLSTPSFNLAQAHLKQGMAQEALLILDQKPFMDSSDPDVVFLKAVAWMQLGGAQRAAPYFKQLPHEWKTREEVSLAYAHWQLVQGQLDEATITLNERSASPDPSLENRAKELRRDVERSIAARLDSKE